MNFTTEEIAGLLDPDTTGRPVVSTAVIDPEQVRDGDGQLFAAFAHPQPLGDTTFVLEDDIAPHVPYLTERWWVGGTAVNGPSTEVMVRAMAGDDRRPTQCERCGARRRGAVGDRRAGHRCLGGWGCRPSTPCAGSVGAP